MASNKEDQGVLPAKIIQQELLTFINDSKQTKDQCPRVLIFPESLGTILLKNIRYQAAMYGLASVYIYVDIFKMLVVCHKNDLRELYIEDFEEEDSESIDTSLLQKHSTFYAAVQKKPEQNAPILSYESATNLSEPNKDKEHTPEVFLELKEIEENLDLNQLTDRTPTKEQPNVVTSTQLKPGEKHKPNTVCIPEKQKYMESKKLSQIQTTRKRSSKILFEDLTFNNTKMNIPKTTNDCKDNYNKCHITNELKRKWNNGDENINDEYNGLQRAKKPLTVVSSQYQTSSQKFNKTQEPEMQINYRLNTSPGNKESIACGKLRTRLNEWETTFSDCHTLTYQLQRVFGKRALFIIATEDYNKFQSGNYNRMEHTVELYNIPNILETHYLLNIYKEGPSYIERCDEGHALLITNSHKQAKQALSIKHKIIKSRCMSEASPIATIRACYSNKLFKSVEIAADIAKKSGRSSDMSVEIPADIAKENDLSLSSDMRVETAADIAEESDLSPSLNGSDTSDQLSNDSMIVNFDTDEFIFEDLTAPFVEKQGNNENSNIPRDASSEHSSNETADALSNWKNIKTKLFENSPLLYNKPKTFLKDLENIYKEKSRKALLVANSIKQVKEALLLEHPIIKAKAMADASPTAKIIEYKSVLLPPMLSEIEKLLEKNNELFTIIGEGEGSIIDSVQHDTYAEEEEDTDKEVMQLEKEIGQGDTSTTGLTALSVITDPKTDQTSSGTETEKSKIIYQVTGHGDTGGIPMQKTCTEEKTVKSTPGEINSD